MVAFILYIFEPDTFIFPDTVKFPEISTLTLDVVFPIPTSPEENISNLVFPPLLKSTIDLAPVWFAIIVVPVPLLVIVNWSVFCTVVFTVVVVPLTDKLPSILTGPFTCKL